MAKIPDSTFEQFIAGCREAAARGLIRASSGNASRRYDEERMLITASGSRLGEMTLEQVAVCRMADGVALNKQKPSVEAGFHAGILRARHNAGVVLHFQSPFATAIACRKGDPPDFNVIPEAPYHVGPVAVVPYLAPGSAALAEAVTAAAQGHDMIVLSNHGAVAVGASFSEAIQRAEFFELACEILVRLGDAAVAIPPEGVAQLRERKRQESGHAA
jgi:ribulose-5-phosphate 4-epimerase/fuculose-1-phosphate aldolase